MENRGPVAVDAILVKDKTLGEAAGLLFIKSAGGNKLSFTFKIWYDAGVQRGTGLVTFVPQPDGTATFSGKVVTRLVPASSRGSPETSGSSMGSQLPPTPARARRLRGPRGTRKKPVWAVADLGGRPPLGR